MALIWVEWHMQRRQFFKAFGIGTAATAATVASGVAVAKSPDPDKRDIKWARARVKEGHRVRLEAWRVPLHERPTSPGDPANFTARVGTVAGFANLDECVVTVEMLEGPWEIVPKEDYPKPPKPFYEVGGDVTIRGGDPGMGGEVKLTSHDPSW